MTVVAVVQARMGSTRLPGKVLMDLGGRPMLAHVLERAAAIPGVDAVCLATTSRSEDRALFGLGLSLGAAIVAHDEHDVLARYLYAARHCKADVIVRITADCPLLDPEISAAVLRRYRDMAAICGVRYCSNTIPTRTYPDGLDTEVFSREALERAAAEATDPADREHVTPWMRRRLMVVGLEQGVDLSALRWTVDTAEDLERVRRIYMAVTVAVAHGDVPAPYSMAATLAAHLKVEGARR